MKGSKNGMEIKPSSEEIDHCISMLKNLAEDTDRLANLPEEQRIALLKVTGQISRPDRGEIKRRNKVANKGLAWPLLKRTGGPEIRPAFVWPGWKPPSAHRKKLNLIPQNLNIRAKKSIHPEIAISVRTPSPTCTFFMTACVKNAAT